ncbi:MAG: DUF6615 family protein [Mesotoga sp.]
MVDLCTLFKSISQHVWRFLELSSTTGIGVSEESITDGILIALAACGGKNVVVRKFSRNQESKNGADLEMWFHLKKKFVGLLIQAKKLDSSSNSYKYIDHKNGKQLSDLLSSASTLLIPSYLLYNFWKKHPKKQLPNPSIIYGCAVSNAHDIQPHLKKPNNTLQSMFPIETPFQCLTCDCESSDHAHLSRLDLRKVAKTFVSREEREMNDYNKYITDNPPDYVRRLLRGEELRLEDKKELKTSRIVVIGIES